MRSGDLVVPRVRLGADGKTHRDLVVSYEWDTDKGDDGLRVVKAQTTSGWDIPLDSLDAAALETRVLELLEKGKPS
jgi:hypothetical protein